MDYSLAALKLFSCQLKLACQTSPSAISLNGILFQRAWLQGVLISGSDEDSFLLDDGSGIVELSLTSDFQKQKWMKGTYVMVVGACVLHGKEVDTIKVHKMVDLSLFPDREAMWNLEVIEAYKMFYQPSVE